MRINEPMPSTRTVRDAWVRKLNPNFDPKGEQAAGGMFDRWLADHDRMVMETAWRRGYFAGQHDYASSMIAGESIRTPNPHSGEAGS